MLRVEVHGMLHDWFDVERMGDFVRSASFSRRPCGRTSRATSRSPRSGRPFSTTTACWPPQDIDFVRAVSRVAPKLYVYDMQAMQETAHLRARTAEELRAIGEELGQFWQHFGACGGLAAPAGTAPAPAHMPAAARSRRLCRPTAAKRRHRTRPARGWAGPVPAAQTGGVHRYAAPKLQQLQRLRHALDAGARGPHELPGRRAPRRGPRRRRGGARGGARRRVGATGIRGLAGDGHDGGRAAGPPRSSRWARARPLRRRQRLGGACSGGGRRAPHGLPG
ncbi:unnamed protein product [Prorocentrum cordatum]|uniref:Uncharacterized protein n=1 Tax=Prorocentrum cordatum TaxID=2364126 RepID=A0ABN9WC75_9DINO|nr:unnamed protein product [Polarella glacialis]